jgi:hypothetical protein
MNHFPTTPAPSMFKQGAASIAVCASTLFCSSAIAVTPLQFQNLVPALYSFDSALALLGLRYGVDPLFPTFTSEGSVTDAGFSWATTGQYLGQSLNWTVAGSFDPGSSTLQWTGSGTYAGSPWVMDGTTQWLSPTDFAIKDSISIAGVPIIYSGALNNPGFNFGTMTPTSGGVDIKELETRHWYSFLFGTTTDGWVVSVEQNGVITVNVYTLAEDASKAGVTVDGGKPAGSIELGGTRYVKNGFVSNIPEPETWLLMLSSLGVLGWFRSRGQRGNAGSA